MVERVTDMAAAAERHVRLAAQRGQDAAQADAAQRFTLRSILAGIKYFRIHDLAEQVGTSCTASCTTHTQSSGPRIAGHHFSNPKPATAPRPMN